MTGLQEKKKSEFINILSFLAAKTLLDYNNSVTSLFDKPGPALEFTQTLEPNQTPSSSHSTIGEKEDEVEDFSSDPESVKAAEQLGKKKSGFYF